ncbi:MAG TPA: histidinol-phosphate transaminase, partial [Candidatus Norongarragalinales archaeon]|nr:histidinol-phosphate transaminase [Candidatus Norongarragalinales archaeon]
LLLEAMSKFLDVPKNQIIFGNGSNEIIELAFRAYLKEGDEVLLAEPSFLVYKLAAQAAGARQAAVPLKNFRYDLETMARKISSRTRIVCIANPDNPTGSYVTAVELERFLKKVSSDTLVILDEAYWEFVDADDFPNSFGYLKRGNILILRTFSKAYGLAGLRMGYGAASPAIIDALHRTRQPFNVNSIAQTAAEAALKDQSHLKKTRAVVWEGKKFWYREFDRMGLEYIPTQTNFVLVNARENGAALFQRLLKKGVIIRDMKAYGLDQFVRITIGTSEENRRCLRALQERKRQ